MDKECYLGKHRYGAESDLHTVSIETPSFITYARPLFLFLLKSVGSCGSSIFANKLLLKQLLIMYTFLNQMRIGKNIQQKDDRMSSLYEATSGNTGCGFLSFCAD